jgi:hypothetical protein
MQRRGGGRLSEKERGEGRVREGAKDQFTIIIFQQKSPEKKTHRFGTGCLVLRDELRSSIMILKCRRACPWNLRGLRGLRGKGRGMGNLTRGTSK